MAHLIRHHNVELIKVLRRQQARAELAEHVAAVLEPVAQVVVVQRPLPLLLYTVSV
jgi:hypothetical protein